MEINVDPEIHKTKLLQKNNNCVVRSMKSVQSLVLPSTQFYFF